VDLDFIAQYLQLRHGTAHPEVLEGSTAAAFARLAQAGLLGASLAPRLIEATRLMRQVQSFLRLARAAEAESFPALKDKILTAAQTAYEAYREIIEEPAKQLGGDDLSQHADPR
jgi:glutamate-ammonia-ligase adenylyltransferase